MAKKLSKNLVPVGTHVPMATKLALQAIAESQDKSVYEFLQEKIEAIVSEYDNALNDLKKKKPVAIEDDSDLLA